MARRPRYSGARRVVYRDAQVGATALTFPVKTEERIYTQRFKAGRHNGIDIAASAGTPVIAVADGTISQGIEGNSGSVVRLAADDGREYFYAHLSAWEGSAPRRVNIGDVIGYVGSTGNATGPHLHFGIYVDGRPIDPYPELTAIQGEPSIPLAMKAEQHGSSASV